MNLLVENDQQSSLRSLELRKNTQKLGFLAGVPISKGRFHNPQTTKGRISPPYHSNQVFPQSPGVEHAFFTAETAGNKRKRRLAFGHVEKGCVWPLSIPYRNLWASHGTHHPPEEKLSHRKLIVPTREREYFFVGNLMKNIES